MVLGKLPPFSETCDGGCGARIVMTARTFDAARIEILAAGWVERRRKGGIQKSHWACPRCGAPAGPSRPITATAMRGIDPPRELAPLPELACVTLRSPDASSPVPPGAVGAIVVVHQGGVAYDLEWCDAEGRTIALLTLTREELVLVP